MSIVVHARNRLKDADLIYRSAAVDWLPENHRDTAHIKFDQDNMNGNWEKIIFSDESVFSLANNRLVRVSRPVCEKHAYSGCVSVSVWGGCPCVESDIFTR